MPNGLDPCRVDRDPAGLKGTPALNAYLGDMIEETHAGKEGLDRKGVRLVCGYAVRDTPLGFKAFLCGDENFPDKGVEAPADPGLDLGRAFQAAWLVGDRDAQLDEEHGCLLEGAPRIFAGGLGTEQVVNPVGQESGGPLEEEPQDHLQGGIVDPRRWLEAEGGEFVAAESQGVLVKDSKEIGIFIRDWPVEEGIGEI